MENKLENVTTLYRGVKQTQEEMVEYEPGLTTNLLGYTSTSKDFATALKFAFEDYKNDKTPVVFEILFKGNNGIFELTKGYSAYPGEQEVLI